VGKKKREVKLSGIRSRRLVEIRFAKVSVYLVAVIVEQHSLPGANTAAQIVTPSEKRHDIVKCL
jgi:hypothetical protein